MATAKGLMRDIQRQARGDVVALRRALRAVNLKIELAEALLDVLGAGHELGGILDERLRSKHGKRADELIACIRNDEADEEYIALILPGENIQTWRVWGAIMRLEDRLNEIEIYSNKEHLHGGTHKRTPQVTA